MGTSVETAATTVGRGRTRGWTTTVSASNDDEWRASQHDVDVSGRGETAVLAAAGTGGRRMVPARAPQGWPSVGIESVRSIDRHGTPAASIGRHLEASDE